MFFNAIFRIVRREAIRFLKVVLRLESEILSLLSRSFDLLGRDQLKTLKANRQKSRPPQYRCRRPRGFPNCALCPTQQDFLHQMDGTN